MSLDQEDIVSASGFNEALVRSFSLARAQILDSNIFLFLFRISLLISHSLWVQPKYTWSKNDVGSPRSTSSMRICQVGSMFSVLPSSVIWSTYTDKNSFSQLTNKLSQFLTFPNSVLVELSQIAFPIIVLPKDYCADSAQEDKLGLPYCTMIFAICALLDVSKYLDILTLDFFNVGASSILTWV